MSIPRIVSASAGTSGEDLRARRPSVPSALSAHARRVWSLGVCWLASCTSFAGLDDRAAPARHDDAPPESSSPVTGGSAPAPGLELPGVVTATPADMTAVNRPPDLPTPVPVPVTGPSASLDAGSLPPLVPADAGTPSGGAPPPPDTVDPACRGLALTLDGATIATVPRVVEDDFTLEAWIETTASAMGAGAFNGRGIFDSDIVGMGPRDDFAVTLINGRVAFGVGNPDTSVLGVQIVTTGQWEHIAVTRRASNGQLQVIVNGVLQAVAVAPNRNSLSARPDLAIGGFTSTRQFIGRIDEVKFWNVVLSVEQIAAGMRQRPTGSEEGLVGYYPFEDQGSGQTADLSSLGLRATLTGNPVYEPSTVLCPPGSVAGGS